MALKGLVTTINVTESYINLSQFGFKRECLLYGRVYMYGHIDSVSMLISTGSDVDINYLKREKYSTRTL